MPVGGMGGSPLGAVFVAINANVAGLVSGTELAKAKLGTFGREVSAVQPQLQRLGTTATIVGAALTAMSVGATMHFAKFESTMANVGAVLGKRVGEMEHLTSLAREWGQTSVFSAREVGEAMYYLASAGFDATEVVDALDATLTLAGATMSSLDDTTIRVVAALNAFNLEASEADRVANVFAATISKSQATADKIGISMRYVAAVANAMGRSLEETSASLGLLYNAGLEASQAGTALRMSLLRLVGTTPKADRALKELGLTAQEVDPTLNSLVDIVRKFEEAGLDPKQARDIFGARSVAAMLGLVNAGADALQEMQDSITDTQKASEQLAIQTDTLEGSMKKLKNAFGEIVLQIGEALAPIIRKLADGLRNLAVWFGNLPGPIKEFFSVTGLVVGVITTLVGIFTLFLSLLPSLIAGWTTLGVVMNTALGPIGLIAAGITGLIALFGTLAARSRDSMKRSVDAIEEEAKAMDELAAKRDNLQNLGRQYDELTTKENRTREESEKLRDVLNQIGAIAPELITQYDEFGNVLDIDRQKMEGLTREMAELHNLRLEVNREAWQKELEQIEATRKAKHEQLMATHRDETAALKKLEDLRDRHEAGEELGVAPSGYHVLTEAERQYESLRQEANSYVDELEELGVQYTRLKNLLTEIDMADREWQGPPTPPQWEGIDWEAEANLAEDQYQRLRQIELDNIEDVFERRREAARRQRQEDLDLAASSATENVELRLAAERRFQQEMADITADEVAERERLEEQAHQAALDRNNELLDRIRAQTQAKRDAADEQIEALREQYYLEEEAYIEHLMRMREANMEDAELQKAIDEELERIATERIRRQKREWQSLHNQIQRGFSTAISGMIVEWDRKTKVFEQIWDRFGKSLTQSIVDKMISPVTSALADFFTWAITELTKLLLKGLGVKLITGGTIGDIGTFKNLSNLKAAAPGQSISKFAPSAQVGGEVTRSGYARIHKGEHLIPPDEANPLRDMIRRTSGVGSFGYGAGALGISQALIKKFAGKYGEDVFFNNDPPWVKQGMTKEEWYEALALRHPDLIRVEAGGIMSTDTDSVDTFFREVWVPAKRRYAREVGDTEGEAI